MAGISIPGALGGSPSPALLEALLASARTGVYPVFNQAVMMPATGEAAAMGAALPVLGTTAMALGATPAVMAANRAITERQPDTYGLLQSLAEGAKRDPRVKPLYERELKRLGVSGVPSSPESELQRLGRLPVGMNTPDAPVAGTPRNTLGPVGGVTSRLGQFGELTEIAKKEADLTKRIAERAPISKGSNLEQAYSDLLANTKRQDVDPLRSRALSDFMVPAGAKMLSSGRVGEGLEAGSKAWGEGVTREEARADKDYERTLQQGLTKLGFREKDLITLNTAEKEKALRDIGIMNSEGIPLAAAKDIFKLKWDAAQKDKDRAVHSPSLGTIAGAEYLRTLPADERGAISGALGKTRETKFDEKTYERVLGEIQQNPKWKGKYDTAKTGTDFRELAHIAATQGLTPAQVDMAVEGIIKKHSGQK